MYTYFVYVLCLFISYWPPAYFLSHSGDYVAIITYGNNVNLIWVASLLSISNRRFPCHACCDTWPSFIVWWFNEITPLQGWLAYSSHQIVSKWKRGYIGVWSSMNILFIPKWWILLESWLWYLNIQGEWICTHFNIMHIFLIYIYMFSPISWWLACP
jgi:hypothetical protein